MIAKLTTLIISLRTLWAKFISYKDELVAMYREFRPAETDASTAETDSTVASVKAKKTSWLKNCAIWFFFWWALIPYYAAVGIWNVITNVVVGLFAGAVAFGVWAFERVGWLIYGMFMLFVFVPVVVIAGLAVLGLVTLNPITVAIAAFLIVALAPFVAGLIWVPVHFIIVYKKARMSDEAKASKAEKKRQDVMFWFWTSLLCTIWFIAVPVVNILCGAVLLYTSLYAINEWRKERKTNTESVEAA